MRSRPSPSNWGLVLLFLVVVPLMMCGRRADALSMATCPRGARQLQVKRSMGSYSHSIVPGGLEVTSYTTRLIPRTSLTNRLEMVLRTSYGRGAQSAVMPSSE